MQKKNLYPMRVLVTGLLVNLASESVNVTLERQEPLTSFLIL